MAPWPAKRLTPLWFSHCRQTNGHITMRWSANVGTTSKTAFTAFGIPFLPCKGKRLVNVTSKTMWNTSRHKGCFCVLFVNEMSAVTLNVMTLNVIMRWLAWDFHVEVWMKSVMRIGSRVMWSQYRRGARKPLQGEMRFLLPLVFHICNRRFKNVIEIIFDLYDRAIFLATWLGMHNIVVPYWLLADVSLFIYRYRLI